MIHTNLIIKKSKYDNSLNLLAVEKTLKYFIKKNKKEEGILYIYKNMHREYMYIYYKYTFNKLSKDSFDYLLYECTLWQQLLIDLRNYFLKNQIRSFH